MTFEEALALRKNKAMDSNRIQFDIHVPADADEEQQGKATVWSGVLGLLKLKGTGLSSDGQTERTGEVGAILGGPHQNTGIFSEAMITIFDLAFNTPADPSAPLGLAPAAARVATPAQSRHATHDGGFSLEKVFLVTNRRHSAMRHWMEVILGGEALNADSEKLTAPYRSLLERQVEGDPDPYVVYCIERDDWLKSKRALLVSKVEKNQQLKSLYGPGKRT